jgi:hypothetical protein
VANAQSLRLIVESFDFQRQILGVDYLIIGLARKETGQDMSIERVPAFI